MIRGPLPTHVFCTDPVAKEIDVYMNGVKIHDCLEVNTVKGWAKRRNRYTRRISITQATFEIKWKEKSDAVSK